MLRVGGDEPGTGDGLTLLFCVVVYGVETVIGGMGRAELNLHVLSQSRRKSFLQGKEFCLSAHSVISSRARGGRVTNVGRTRLGRGAVEPWARGDEYQGGRNDFLRFQEQLLRRKKQKLFLGVSVGNGVRGGDNFVNERRDDYYSNGLKQKQPKPLVCVA